MKPFTLNRYRNITILLILGLGMVLGSALPSGTTFFSPPAAKAQTTAFTYLPLIIKPPDYQPPPDGTPRVNAPYFPVSVSSIRSAVFWFGEVTPSINYTDVRVGYTSSELVIRLAVIDRRLWTDGTPVAGDLENWDAATVYLNLAGNTGTAPGSSTYRLVSQMNTQTSPNPAWSAAYRGNGSGWTEIPINFTGTSGWRGNAVNDTIDDHGWSMTYNIPFANLGLSGPPNDGTVWGLGVSLHDRDDNPGAPLADQHWPAGLQPATPASWGQISFGWPDNSPPPIPTTGSVTIRHGVNGVNMSDAAVGGHSTCGGAINYWTDWGYLNWAGYEQVNVQNQWLDISDWPCFSKLYLDIPLDDIPTNKVIKTATLTLNHFGNSGGGQWGDPPDSYIQVLTTGGNWSESQINWNNAPYAIENITMTLVPPLLTFPGWPGVPRYFDVSNAVAAAYEAGDSILKLVVYSADGPRHTGKYFYSADADEAGRPTLTVEWGDP